MNVDEMIDRENMTIGSRTFALSRIPAIQAQEIYGDVVKSTANVGDIGMTFLPKEVSKRLLSYVAYDENGVWMMLDNDAEIQTALPDLLDLIKVEAAMIRKNFGFLLNGKLLEVLEQLRA